MISFADSTNPAAIPSQFTHVAAYANGRYAWTPQQIARFKAHIMIAVTGDPAEAAVARVQDDELFDATPAQFPAFAAERERLGHGDATSYTSILGQPGFGVAAVVAALEQAAFTGPWRLWVAWWWGRPFPPTATEVLAEIRTLTGIILPSRRLYACQWQNGQHYDSSVLYQRDDFTRSAA